MSFNEFLKRCKSNPWRVDRETISGSPVPVIMGILNVTPDSFFDGGLYKNEDNALKHAIKMVEEGADIIDLGGESTRPGHVVITEEEEIARVTPVIEAIKRNFDIPISIDTYKGKVTLAALQAGADLVNDIWGLRKDPKMADVIAARDAVCCLMHNRNNPEYADAQNKPVIGGGVVLKFNAQQRYATDGIGAALLRRIAQQKELVLQPYANRSDMPGGSTLGNIASTRLPIRTIDIGLPQLAMHSAFETAGTYDYLQYINVCEAFYRTEIFKEQDQGYLVRG